MRQIFQIMQNEDRSQDPQILAELSDLWEKMHEEILHFKKDSHPFFLFQKWFALIDSYPEDQEYSLGYYLSQNAGSHWLPFPYMEMIHKLHVDHQKNPHESVLSQWISSLDTIISLLQPD